MSLTINIDLILWLTFFCWHYCLFCGFISDDHAAVCRRRDIIPDEERVDRGESFWVKRLNDGLIMFYQSRLFWKLGFERIPFPWHALSLFFHITNTYLLYLFLLPIFGEQRAVFTCAFWAVNPMINQNVCWISARPYLFGMFLNLVALICWKDPLTFSLFYLLAMNTNISGFFIPIILWMIYPNEWQTLTYLGVMVLGALPILIWKFNARFTKGLIVDRDNFKPKLRKLNTFARMTTYYIYCLFFPGKMGWYHQAGFRYNQLWEKFNYLTFIGYIILGFMVYSGIPGWWFILGFLPNSNIYATNSFLQDRYLYFCSVGAALIVSPILATYPEIFYCAITFYITRSYMYSKCLVNDEQLYRENWRNHPKSDFCINNLSYFLIQQRRYDEARVVIEQGLNINNSNRMLWYNLGITYAAQGHFGNDEGKFKFLKALECWKTCLHLEPRWIKPTNDLRNLIKMLLDHKVITQEKGDSANGMQITIPNLIGIKEMLDEKKAIPAEVSPTTGSS